MKNYCAILFIHLFLMMNKSASAQKKSLEIGGKIFTEFEQGETYEPGIGAQLVYRLTKHSGLETGIYYKVTANNFFYSDMTGNLYQKNVKENTMLFHFLYRFDSKFLNFTAGPALKYFMGLKKRKENPPAYVPPYDEQRFELISTISISKNFWLSPSLILEPEIRGSAFIPNGGGGISLNISLRKKIF